MDVAARPRLSRRLVRALEIAATTYVRTAGGQRAAAISYRVLFSLVPFVALLVSVLELVLPESDAARCRFLARGRRVPARRARPERGRRGQGCRAAGVRHGRHRTRRADLGRERDDGLGALGLPGGLGQRGRSALSARQAARLRARARSRRARRLCVRALARRPGGHRDEQRDRGGARPRGVRDRRPRCGRAARRLARARLARVRVSLPVRPARGSDASGMSCRARSWRPSGVHLASAGFSIYLARFGGFNNVFGPLGAILAFLLLVYAVAAILLLGACVAAAWPETATEPEAGRESRCRFAAASSAPHAGSSFGTAARRHA